MSQKNFMLENIKRNKSPEKKDGKSMDKTLMNTLSKAEISKTFTNKDLSTLKVIGEKNKRLDPLIGNSFKLKTASDGFK